MMPTDEHINARRTRYKEDENGIVTATTTFSCKFQLTGKPIYAKYPFMIFKYSAIVELSTFEFANFQFRPNMVFHKNTVTKGEMWRHFCVRDPFEDKFDGSIQFDFVTPFPSVKVIHASKGDYCPKFEIAFYLKEPILMKLVNTFFPLAYIIILNALHVLSPQENGDYIGNSSGIALTLIFSCLLSTRIKATKWNLGRTKSPSYLYSWL